MEPVLMTKRKQNATEQNLFTKLLLPATHLFHKSVVKSLDIL